MSIDSFIISNNGTHIITVELFVCDSSSGGKAWAIYYSPVDGKVHTRYGKFSLGGFNQRLSGHSTPRDQSIDFWDAIRKKTRKGYTSAGTFQLEIETGRVEELGNWRESAPTQDKSASKPKKRTGRARKQQADRLMTLLGVDEDTPEWFYRGAA